MNAEQPTEYAQRINIGELMNTPRLVKYYCTDVP